MSMRNKGERHWRTKGKRGVSPIIATILLVAITVVLAAVLYILISGLTKGPGNTPIGTALAVGTDTPATAGTGHWYNFSIQSAGGGLTLGSMNFAFQTTTGSIVPPGGTWTLTVVNILTGATVGTYTLASGTWASGSGTPASSQMNIDVYSAAVALTGDNMIVSGTGSFAGSISVAIS
ncbi:MAG TPA: type IV pilin N-terminal domain-containing protein [Thermoplasmata archaeon]|nr:type IV pilin N-terminal domain-containing protein [Thermoplasmata archaeon]